MSDPHRIVSSDSENLILVDERDNEIGSQSKTECHNGRGILHRAFSLFLFNDRGELLLQRRGKQKRLWPGYWSNSCCSHPRQGESLPIAMKRRLSDELNIAAELEYVYQFCYQAKYSSAGSENELCHVYLGNVSGELRPNDSEIESIRFVPAKELDLELASTPREFTPWLKQEWQTLNDDYRDQLEGYAM